MGIRDRGWIEILTNNEVEVLWSKLFDLVSRHSSVRMLYPSNEFSADMLKDNYCDLTQDLFLRLYEKERWQYYLNHGYTDERIQQELYRIEVPNMVTRLQRKQRPESYRIARRISDLMKSRPEFQYYPRPLSASGTLGSIKWTRGSNKMVLKLYGLSTWSSDKSVKQESELPELIKDVAFRNRDIRRTGRGAGSQVIISNEDLVQLIVDVFSAIDTPLAVRKMRSLVMSKLPIENSRPVSINAPVGKAADADGDMPQLELPDDRPTPLDTLLKKEQGLYIERLADEILCNLKQEVRNKPQRYNKLVRVAWHCYFDPASPSQTGIARTMGISDSLVSHYRSIFDSFIQCLGLSIDEFILLNSALSNRLSAMVSEPDQNMKAEMNAGSFCPTAKSLVKAASRGAYSRG